MEHFIKDLVMNVSKERINEVFIMVGRDFFNGKKNPIKRKVTGIKYDLDKGHGPFYSIEGKHNFYFYSLFPHILSM